MYANMPEPPITPPEERYITADCGHELYAGESMYTWEGKTLCSDCFKEKIDEMNIDEWAAALDVEVRRILIDRCCHERF